MNTIILRLKLIRCLLPRRVGNDAVGRADIDTLRIFAAADAFGAQFRIDDVNRIGCANGFIGADLDAGVTTSAVIVD